MSILPFSGILFLATQAALRLHPDTLGTTEPLARDAAGKSYLRLQEAYTVLGNESRRRLYDATSRSLRKWQS